MVQQVDKCIHVRPMPVQRSWQEQQPFFIFSNRVLTSEAFTEYEERLPSIGWMARHEGFNGVDGSRPQLCFIGHVTGATSRRLAEARAEWLIEVPMCSKGVAGNGWVSGRTVVCNVPATCTT